MIVLTFGITAVVVIAVGLIGLGGTIIVTAVNEFYNDS